MPPWRRVSPVSSCANGLEQTLHVALGDADAGVAHRERRPRRLAAFELEAHFAAIGELDRVPGEVDEDLPNLVDVARHANRLVRERW